MEKHFKPLSNNYPDLVVKLEQVKAINYQEIEVDKETNKNEFDETTVRSQREEKAQVNYKTDLTNTPSEEIILDPKIVQAAIPMFYLLLMQLHSASSEDQSGIHYNSGLKYSSCSSFEISPIGENNQDVINAF